MLVLSMNHSWWRPMVHLCAHIPAGQCLSRPKSAWSHRAAAVTATLLPLSIWRRKLHACRGRGHAHGSLMAAQHI